MENYRQIGDYYISNCINTRFPCQHYVKYQNGNRILLCGDQIYCMLKLEGLSDPHFDEYIQPVPLPTPE